MFYVIKKGRLYVAKPGRSSSYTSMVEYAQKFLTYETAKLAACGNETVVQISYR